MKTPLKLAALLVVLGCTLGLLSCESKTPAPVPAPVTSVPVAAPAPATEVLKARAVVGTVQYRTTSDTNWLALKVGKKVDVGMLIKTARESLTELVSGDGSTITVRELSEITVDTLLEKAGLFQSRMDMEKGSLEFKIQKVAGMQKNISFGTPTAVAAIRGTEGRLYASPTSTAAYLNSGKLWLTDKNTKSETTIEAKQAAVQTSQGFQVRKLATEGTQRNFVDSLESSFKKINLSSALRGNAPVQALQKAVQSNAQAQSKAVRNQAAQALDQQKAQVQQKVQALKSTAQSQKASAQKTVTDQKKKATATAQKKAASATKNLKNLVP